MNKTSLKQIQKEYIRGKEILNIAADADNTSMQAQLIRLVWKPHDLMKLQNMITNWEDQGILRRIRKAD